MDQILEIIEPLIIIQRQNAPEPLLTKFGQQMERHGDLEELKSSEEQEIGSEDLGAFGDFGELEEIDR